MKVINKIGIAASLVMTALISSCSDKGYWDEAPLEDAYSFNAANYNEDLKPGPQEVKITLHRSSTANAASVDVKFAPAASCPKDITVESPVVFAAGSSTADVIIRISNANPPYTYSGTLTFEGETSYAGVAECKLNLPVSYTWESLGEGGFFDAFVMDNAEDYFPVEILKAEGFARYRVMAPYKQYYATIGQDSWEDWIGSSGPAYVEFWELGDGKLSFNSYATGLLYQGPGGTAIGAYNWSSFGAGSGYTGDMDMWYKPGLAVLSPVYYVNGVGGYGQQQFAVQIVLP